MGFVVAKLISIRLVSGVGKEAFVKSLPYAELLITQGN